MECIGLDLPDPKLIPKASKDMKIYTQILQACIPFLSTSLEKDVSHEICHSFTGKRR